MNRPRLKIGVLIVSIMVFGFVRVHAQNYQHGEEELSIYNQAITLKENKEFSKADSTLNLLPINQFEQNHSKISLDIMLLKGRLKLLLYQTDSSIFYYRNALKKYEYDADKEGINSTHRVLVAPFMRLGQYDSAFYYINQCIKHDSINSPNDKYLKSLKTKAEIHLAIGNTEAGLNYLMHSLDLSIKGENKNLQAILLLRIGRVYMNVEEFSTAETYMDQALSIYNPLQDSVEIALVNYRKTILYLKWNKLIKATESNSTALSYCTKEQNQGLFGQLVMHKAELLLKNEDFEKAKSKSDEAYLIYKNNHQKSELAKVYLFWSELYQKTHDYNKSIQWIDSALALTNFFHDPLIRINIYHQKALISKLNGDENDYNKYNNLYSNIKDSVVGIKSLRAVLDREMDLAIVQSEKELAELNKALENVESDSKRSKIFYAIIILSSLLIFSLILTVRKKRSRIKLEEKEKNEEQLAAELKKKQAILKEIEATGQVPKQVLPAHFEKLSTREKEVFDLLVDGLSDKEISEKLYISLATVRTHVRHIYEKFHIKSRMEAKDISLKYRVL